MFINDNILKTIGNTPLVKINKINNLECDILAKCEYFNFGGSIKDRIAIHMIEKAEKENKIKPGITTLIEPTSGNTGISLAIVAAIKGYKMIVTIPERMSNEKIYILNALGCKIYRTNSKASHDSEESHIGLAKKLNREIENSFILDQYNNQDNVETHYENTAEEILKQCDGKIDMVCCGVGTGGTITGIAKKIKEKLPNCKIVGIDPIGSKVALPSNLNNINKPFKIEGIGHDFIPSTLNRSFIDQWIKTDDQESFLMSRRLIKDEGLLCGGSSGAVMVGALKAATQLKKGQRCVIILPDTIRNYMTKHLVDDWLLENYGIVDSQNEILKNQFTNIFVNDFLKILNKSQSSLNNCILIDSIFDNEILNLFKRNGNIEELPIISNNNKIIGIISLNQLLNSLNSFGKPINNIIQKNNLNFNKFSLSTNLFEIYNHIINEKNNSNAYVVNNNDELLFIISKIDFLNYYLNINK